MAAHPILFASWIFFSVLATQLKSVSHHLFFEVANSNKDADVNFLCQLHGNPYLKSQTQHPTMSKHADLAHGWGQADV